MANQVVDVTEAVVVALNGATSGTFSQGFLAKRAYHVTADLKTLDGILRVLVVPRGTTHTILSRSSIVVEVEVDVGVLKKLSEIDNISIDTMMQLVQEILDFLTGLKPVGFSWVGVDNDPVYSPEHMLESKQFVSVVRARYRGVMA